MSKQQEKPINRAPYRVYSLIEFQRLATLGIWPGANVEGVGYVHQGRPIPKYISVYNSKWTKGSQAKRTTLLDKINSGVLYGGIAAGTVEHSKMGSLSLYYKGRFNPAYYEYNAKLGRGWGGGSSAMIETTQISGNGVGRMVGNGLLVVGIGCNFWVAGDALINNDPNKKSIVLKAGIDSGMGVVGTLGPIGFVISTVYFLIDPLSDKPSSEIHNNEITPIDELRVKKNFPQIYKPTPYKLDVPIKDQPILKPGKNY